ncbi:MAG: hypothetical protein ACRCXM_14490 [Beijerinckiaceae bacterium]
MALDLMRHPILKTFVARLRAIEAMERATFALTTVDALIEPFERHRLRVAMTGTMTDTPELVSLGETVGGLFPKMMPGLPVEWLMRPADRPIFRKTLAGLMAEEMACYFAGTMPGPEGMPLVVEGLIVPEPPVSPYASPTHVSLCVVSEEGWGLNVPQPGVPRTVTLGATRYITLENRGPARLDLFRPRWPQPDRWHSH